MASWPAVDADGWDGLDRRRLPAVHAAVSRRRLAVGLLPGASLAAEQRHRRRPPSSSTGRQGAQFAHNGAQFAGRDGLGAGVLRGGVDGSGEAEGESRHARGSVLDVQRGDLFLDR
jgi:hypothetical protein